MNTGEALAEEYARQTVTRPMEAIWCYHFINGNKDVAQSLWATYIQKGRDVFYMPITAMARQRNDEGMVLELIEYLKSSVVGNANLNGAYSTLMEIYSRKRSFDDALRMVEIIRARSGHFTRTSLLHLKAGLEKEGRKFPYQIPLAGRKVVL